MSRYVFIDGGFLDSLVERTARYFELEGDLRPLAYGAIAGPYQRTFYYDAFPAKKENEDEAAYALKLRAKEQKFERINRTPFMHTREGITRNRTGGGTRLEQKGVDILLAIDVYKHASIRTIDEAHIMSTDLDFFPLFEALRDTPVSTHLHCYPPETSKDLMFLADQVYPVNFFTILQWSGRADSIDTYVRRNVRVDHVDLSTVVKEGELEGHDFKVYSARVHENEVFYGRARSRNWDVVAEARKCEHLVPYFEWWAQSIVRFE